MRRIYFLVVLLFFFPALAWGAMSYEGQLLYANGTPINSETVTFSFRVFKPGDNTCLLYRENFSLTTGTYGEFELRLGTGTVVYGAMPSAMSNTATLTCQNTVSYTPGSVNDARLIEVYFDHNGNNGNLADSFTTADVPSAYVAQTLTNTLDLAKGGTGLNNLGAANQMLGVNNAGTALEYKNITAGSGVTVTHGANSIQISASSTGTVSNVSGTAPISVATGTSTPVISMTQANTTTPGYLSAVDWTTFNNKLGAVAGSTLNDGRIWVGNATNQATVVQMSGDATLSNAGVLTLGTIAVAKGGTGATTAAGARTSLGLGSLSTVTPTGTADNTTYLRGDGTWATVAAGGGGDFMANGTVQMTGNIRLNGNYLSGDGGAEGIMVDASGNVSTSGNMISAGEVRSTTGSMTSMLSIASGYTSSGSAASPNGPAVKAVNGSSTNLAAANFYMQVNNSSLLSQRAFISAVSTSGASTYSPALVFGQQTGASSYEERMRIDSAGNVGIGTTTPQRALHVGGPIRIAASPLPSSSLMAGDIAIDSADSNKLKYYDGSSWQTAGGTAGATTVDGLTDAITSTPNRNLFIGDTAGAYSSGTYNTAIGINAIYLPTSASYMTAVGSFAMRNTSGGAGSTAIGAMALYNNTTGVQNTAVGSQTMVMNTTGNNNTTLGYYTGNQLTGSDNTLIGHESGKDITTGSRNILIGKSTATPLVTSNDHLNIGNLIYGDLSANKFVGINNPAPGSALDIKGTLRLSGSTSGYVGFAAPAAAGSTTYTLPNGPGTNGQVLTTDGFGVLSWATAGGGGSGDVINGGNTVAALMTIGTNSNYGLAFETNGTEKMRIDSSGNVGIGTTTPQRMLHVAGPIRIAPTSLSGAAAAGDLGFDSGASNALKWYNGTAWQTVSSGGISMTANRLIGTGATGTAMSEVTCSLNQVMSFDASGNWTCANVSSLISAVLDGGNTTGAAMSIGTNDSNNLYFRTGGTNQMTITSGGNVGIGTTSPSYPLQIANGSAQISLKDTNSTVATGIATNVMFRDSADVDAGFVGFGGSTDLKILNSGNYPTTFWNNNAERMRITGNGEVGIGTATPLANAALHIVRATNPEIKIGSSASSGPARLGIPTTAGQISNNTLINSFVMANDVGALHFGTNSTSPSVVRMTVAASGNVGIGITNPTSILDISRDLAGEVDVNIENLNAGTNATAGLNMVNNSMMFGSVYMASSGHANLWKRDRLTVEADTGVNIIAKDAAVGVGDVRFFTGNASGTERVRIDNAGNVGIGTTNPTFKLEVNGDSKFNRAPVTGEYNAASALTIDFSQGGIIHSNTAAGSSFTFSNLQPGSYANWYLTASTAGTPAISAGCTIKWAGGTHASLAIGTVRHYKIFRPNVGSQAANCFIEYKDY